MNIASSTPGSATVFKTSEPHGLSSGVVITISDHSTISGSFVVEVVDATKFKAKSSSNGSYVSTGAAGSGGKVKAELTEWENTSFTPVVGVPYQRVHVLFAEPENPTFGVDHVRETGFMQITLHFPKQVGTGAINARIELIREVFKRNTTLEFGGVKVIVTKTPEKAGGAPLEQSYAVAVRVPFRCDIYS